MLLELSQLSQGRSSHEPTELKTTSKQQLCKDVDLLDFHIPDKQTSYNLTADKSQLHEVATFYIAPSDLLRSYSVWRSLLLKTL